MSSTLWTRERDCEGEMSETGETGETVDIIQRPLELKTKDSLNIS